MTVGQLIKKLEKYNKDSEVMIDIYDGWNNPSVAISSVYMDCAYDNDGCSTMEKSVYLEANIIS